MSVYRRTEKLTLIGEGTYGSVFLARDPNNDLVALKKIRKEKKEGVSATLHTSSPPPSPLPFTPSPLTLSLPSLLCDPL